MSEETSILKTVFCSYRGTLIVHDVHGAKVEELSGEMTLDKHNGIEQRKHPDITEFDGKENYDNTLKRIKSQEEDKERKEREKEERKREKEKKGRPKPPPQVGNGKSISNYPTKSKMLNYIILGLVIVVFMPMLIMFVNRYVKKK